MLSFAFFLQILLWMVIYWYMQILLYMVIYFWFQGILLYMHPANERWHYNEMSSLIGWAHMQNDPQMSSQDGDIPISG